jgi:hypothetical protein
MAKVIAIMHAEVTQQIEVFGTPLREEFRDT